MYMEFSYLDFYSIISLIFFSTSFVKNFDQKKENIFFNDDYEHYPNTWDEMFKNDGKVRRSYKFLEKFLNNSSFDSIKEKQDFSDQFFMNQGITFTVYDNDQGVERIFPFDISLKPSLSLLGRIPSSRLLALSISNSVYRKAYSSPG